MPDEFGRPTQAEIDFWNRQMRMRKIIHDTLVSAGKPAPKFSPILQPGSEYWAARGETETAEANRRREEALRRARESEAKRTASVSFAPQAVSSPVQRRTASVSFAPQSFAPQASPVQRQSVSFAPRAVTTAPSMTASVATTPTITQAAIPTISRSRRAISTRTYVL